ncbi:MAG: aldo/keto reductase [Actinobacteria bacterium]|nr:aldo/keto reductase [Actinomycetota bacterium]MBM3697948.1 aldo/keto reductase [Actinomycetota bacterium]
MRQRHLGDGTPVGEIALGAMAFADFYAGRDDDAGVAAIHRALDEGITMIDTAEVYGMGHSEAMVGQAVRGRRDPALVATKAIKGHPDYLRRAIDRSLMHLGLDHVDLYYLHRVDQQVPIEESAGAMADLIAEGKVRAYGLSEAAGPTIRRAHGVHPVAALQTEYSLLERDPEVDLLPVTRELGIAFVAYSPLARGLLTGTIRTEHDLQPDDWRRDVPRFRGANLAHNVALLAPLEQMADRLGTTPAAIALAWLLTRGEDIIPLVGMGRPQNVDRALEATRVDLSPDDLAALDAAFPIGAAAGTRYPESMMSGVHV